MPEQAYAVTESGTYGVRAQPAVVARMRPHLVLTRVGLAAAVVALVLGAVAGRLFAPLTHVERWWSPLLVGGSVVLVAVCALQAWVWGQAMAEWSGRRDVNLARFLMPSYAAHWLSYAALACALFGALRMMGDAGSGSPAFWLALVAAVAGLVAQLTSAVEYLRLDGPPGTLPAHFRRLVRSQNPDTAGLARARQASGVLREGGVAPDDAEPPADPTR